MAEPLDARAENAAPSNSPALGCLSQALRTGNEPERCLAAKGLGLLGGREAADALIDALRDPDPDVRCEIALALARAGDENAAGPLLDNLRDDPVGEIKPLYIKALQALGAEEAFDSILALATGRGEASGIRWEDDGSGWDDWLDAQLAALEALGALTPDARKKEACEAVVAALRDPEGQEPWAVACGSLARLGGAGIDALTELAATASPLNRQRIAASLRHAEGTEAEAPLRRLAADGDVFVRIAAFETAGAAGLDDVLQAALDDVAPEARATAYDGLDAPSPKVLAAGLNDASPQVRIAACRAVERAGGRVPGLGLVRRIERSIRTGNAAVLAAMTSAAAVAEPEEAAELVADIVNRRATATPVRLACLRTLGALKPAEAAELLAQAAGDDPREVRLAALAALGEIAKDDGPETPAAVAALISALDGGSVPAPAGRRADERAPSPDRPRKDERPRREGGRRRVELDGNGNVVRTADVGANSKSRAPANDSPPLSTLDSILDDETRKANAPEFADVEIDEEEFPHLARARARLSKRRLNPEYAPPVHADAPHLAARVMAATPRPEFAVPLAEASHSDDGDLALAALDALTTLAQSGVELTGVRRHILRHCRARDAERRAKSVLALSAVESEDARAALEPALDDEDGAVRRAALAALSERPRARMNIHRHCKDADRRVRHVAARLAARRQAKEALPVLMEYALAEDAAQSRDAACLLARFGEAGFRKMTDLAQCGEPKSRLTGMSMLAHALENAASALSSDNRSQTAGKATRRAS